MDLIVNHSTRIDLVFDAVEQERMLADLTQLHKLITETLDTTLLSVTLLDGVH